MSRNAEITLLFYDQERTFRLGIKELRKLQEKCGERGPQRIMRDLEDGNWMVDDIIQPIQLGLIGGGMKPEEAARLVKERVEDRPLAECLLFALVILQAAVVGPPGDPIDQGKGAPSPGEQEVAKTGSTSPTSTELEPPSGGQPDKSMN